MSDTGLTSPHATGAVARPSLFAYACLSFAVIAWGGSFVAARLLLRPSSSSAVALSPTLLAAARFSLASVFFIVPLGRTIVRRQVSPGDLLRLAGLGLLAYTVYFWLQYTGVQQTSASVASILVVGLIPLATALLSRLTGTGQLNRTQVAALLLGFIGVSIVALQQGLTGLGAGRDTNFAFGALCLVANAIVFALYSILSKRWMRAISPITLTGTTMLSGALGLILLSFADPSANRWSDIGRLTGTQIIALLFLTLVCSVAAYFAYNFALTKTPADRAALFVYFEPVVAVALGTALLDERLSWQSLLGALLIAASVLIVHRAGSSGQG
ncbi:MAG TPA: EamA family transporter [Ktedonobacterales bacterium]